MMRDVAERGSGTRGAQARCPTNVPIAGKTGTTNDNVDVWFVGMTPDLVAGVWLGFDRPKTIMKGAVGGPLAAPIWGQMIGRYYAGRSSARLGSAAGRARLRGARSRTRGHLATPTTPPDQRYTEYFLPGTEPLELREQSVEGAAVGPAVRPAATAAH